MNEDQGPQEQGEDDDHEVAFSISASLKNVPLDDAQELLKQLREKYSKKQDHNDASEPD